MKIQIADIQLPETSVENIASILESNNMPLRLPTGRRIDFNCWGFTAFYCEWIDNAVWLDNWQMEDYLKNRTVAINKEDVKAGDIAIFRCGNYLRHTAIVLPTEKGQMVCHKPGANFFCIDALDVVAHSYGVVSYARVKEKESEETI